jgi:hypothetical protein
MSTPVDPASYEQAAIDAVANSYRGDADGQEKSDFLREAQVWATLHLANVVKNKT